MRIQKLGLQRAMVITLTMLEYQKAYIGGLAAQLPLLNKDEFFSGAGCMGGAKSEFSTTLNNIGERVSPVLTSNCQKFDN